MRNHLARTSVAQRLDEYRLTGRLRVPVRFILEARCRPGSPAPVASRRIERAYSLMRRRRKALPTTLTDESAIAAAAMIGE
ncbi:MAG: hypothetical protein ACXWU2_08260, partial [Allosphingosinicella sp.]